MSVLRERVLVVDDGDFVGDDRTRADLKSDPFLEAILSDKVVYDGRLIKNRTGALDDNPNNSINA